MPMYTSKYGFKKPLQTENYNIDDQNGNWDKVDTVLDRQLTEKPPVSISLKLGPQVVESDVVAPLTGLQIKGRTLVNLLGREGNCESMPGAGGRPWSAEGGTITLDSTNKTNGLNGFKITLTAATSTFFRNPAFPLTAGKYYVAAVDVKNGNVNSNNVTFQFANTSKTVTMNSAAFTTVFMKGQPSVDSSGFALVFTGSSGQYVYVDSARVYEITKAEYDALDSMTPEQVAAKWPYVDDMKSVYSPYVIKYGENLLPPFSEWGFISPAGSLQEPYTLSITAGTNPIAYNAWVIVPVLRNTEYTLSAQHNGRIAVYALSGQPIIDYTTAGSLVFDSGNNDAVQVYISTNGSSGIFTFTNPMLNVGSVALPFKPRNDDHLFFPNANLASDVEGTVYDTLFQRDGKYWKQACFKTMELDGKLEWRVGATKYTSFRQVRVSISNGVSGSGTVIKYDGKVLSAGNTNAAADIQALSVDGNLYLSIAAADSGWGDSYENLTEDEIKAYFYGWKMKQFGQGDNVPYTSGTKEWVQILNPVGTQTTTLPRTPAPGFTSYKLQYQLAAATVEEIASEGGITLHEGTNQITVGTGMVVREKANPQTNAGLGYAAINVKGSPNYTDAGALKSRVSAFLGIHKNSRIDGAWTQKAGGGNGNYYVDMPIANFDPAATYTVTYLALDQYALSCNLLSLESARPANMKSVVDTLAVGHADMAARVGALEITRAQRAQPQWIAPTLVNGWVNFGSTGRYDAAYLKDSMGFVHIRGTIKNGALSMPAFILPAGYRPSKDIVCLVQNAASNAVGKMVIRYDGAVIPNEGTTTEVGFDTISFLAEK
ncbi:hypothetical protein ABEX47_17575 [Paenibacillus ehimensis]|uniref:hypothetical protein n=1 Tax=Paenibacillus ehimensis TaxID=79264 RepID=UPI003D2B0AF4